MRFILLLLPIIAFSATFNLKLSKNNPYLNEPITAKFSLIYNKDENISKINFDEFELKNFKIVKTLTKTEFKDNIITKNYYFWFIPLIKDKLKIKPIKIKIYIKESNTILTNNKYLFTKPKIVDVLEPKALISGDLNLKLNAEKTKFNKDEPINLNLTLIGVANFDLIDFNLDLPNITYFKSKPKIKYFLEKNIIKANYSQNFIINANKSFSVNPIELKYFNTVIKDIEYLKSKEIRFEIKKDYSIYFYILIAFILGLIIGSFLKFKTKKTTSFVKELKKAKDTKKMQKLLLPYANLIEVQIFLQKLQKSKKLNKNLKKEILDFFS
jgi:hypothetical protein